MNVYLICEKHGILVSVLMSLPSDQKNHALRSYENAHLRAYPDCNDKIKVQAHERTS